MASEGQRDLSVKENGPVVLRGAGRLWVSPALRTPEAEKSKSWSESLVSCLLPSNCYLPSCHRDTSLHGRMEQAPVW